MARPHLACGGMRHAFPPYELRGEPRPSPCPSPRTRGEATQLRCFYLHGLRISYGRYSALPLPACGGRAGVWGRGPAQCAVWRIADDGDRRGAGVAAVLRAAVGADVREAAAVGL